MNKFNNLVVNDTAPCDKKNKDQQSVIQQVDVFCWWSQMGQKL